MTVVKNGGVTSAQGFRANGLNCGIKRSGKPDLSLIVCEQPAVAAGVVTKNSIKAAPLTVTQRHLRNHQARAIICNSGNANCFTGKFGLIYAQRMAELVAQRLSVKASDVLVASTGIIGKPLPIKKIAAAAGPLVKGLSRAGGRKAARGILTTDTVTKEIAVRVPLGGKKVTIGACAKGSGMIQPNMATMLAFITTDAVIRPAMLRAALRTAVEHSFNRITVDGCMSTNDMVVVLASGRAGNKRIATTGKDFKNFCAALQWVCLDLSKKIVLDGEGATKFLTIAVDGAGSEKEARKVAMAIANSNLVKTAAYGSNPNWGRVAAAVGAVGLRVTERNLRIKFSPFRQKNIRIHVNLNLGAHAATVYTSDLSPEYVAINGKYN